ncbi:MAG TPA: protein kinase, partial [Pseudonocardiaceae bacterium]|nr:protein kinase [Pseudonocardiaceae bacterium]
TDFGLSRKLDASVRFTKRDATAAYAAPETWSGAVSPARDWWSLGIMVLELCTGSRPFDRMDDQVVQKSVITKPVPVDVVEDRRLRLLCAGLLVGDPDHRWAVDKVREWLAGGTPAVPDRRVPAEVDGFEFQATDYSDPESLAAAMVRGKNWEVAARRYGISPSPSWTALTTWLHQFDTPGRYPAGVVEQRLDLLGQLEKSHEKPNAKLLRLIHGLNPELPPFYRGVHVDLPRLRQLARTAEDGPPADRKTVRAHEVIDELWRGALLRVLAGFDGGAELAGVDQRWRDLMARLDKAVVAPPGGGDVTALERQRWWPAALAAMLEIAAGQADRVTDWTNELHRCASALAAPIDWFTQLVRRVGIDPASAYAALVVSGVARAQAQQIRRDEDARRQARQAREQRWAAHEQQRMAGRSAAMREALIAATALSGLWVFGALLSAKTGWLLLVAVAAGTHYIAECLLAETIGGDYRPRYSLWQQIRESAGRLGRRMQRSPGVSAAVIIGMIVLFGLLSQTVPVIAVAGAVAHVIWTAVRQRRWNVAHETERQQALNS